MDCEQSDMEPFRTSPSEPSTPCCFPHFQLTGVRMCKLAEVLAAWIFEWRGYMENSCPHQPGVTTLDFYTRNKTLLICLDRPTNAAWLVSSVAEANVTLGYIHSYTSISAISIWQSMGNYYLDTEDISSSKIQLID